MLFKSVIVALAAATSVYAQNCGPAYGNQICAAGSCCSQYGWCDTDAAHCDPKTCIPKFSGPGSSCAKLGQSSSSTLKTTSKTTSKTSTKTSSTTTKASTTTTTKASTTTTSTSTFNGPYVSLVPNIDVCGSGSGSQNISCPGAGIGGYFYRCCSDHGHCGPKNNIQDESVYCGTGCQPGFGSCVTDAPKPPNPTGIAGVAQMGETCGPIVNKKCATGLCCSGSNYCGTGDDFCGSANWCQASWGQCS